jgi:plastocyanin
MDKETTRSSRWYYGFAVLVLVLGCLAATTITALGMRGLPSLIAEAHDLSRMTQVVIPGSAEVTFPETGAYAVYYEYRSVVDGLGYIGSEIPPSFVCSLTSNATGADVPVVPDYVETNGYSVGRGSRVGVLAMSITINEPGTYTFSCRYPDGRAEPKVVVVVGHNIVWELFGIAARPLGSIVASMAVVFSSAVAAIIIAIVVAMKTHPPKKQLDAAEGPGGMKPKSHGSGAVPI